MGSYREIGWSYPPKDYGRWADLIRATAAHLAERYGAHAVASWYFELWNEPDIFYWSGTIEDYCRLFDVTEQALHGVLPQARLGGPTVAGVFDQGAGREAMQAFLRHCKTGTNACGGETGTRLDFVTFHVKGAEFFADPNVAKAVPSVGNLVNQVRTGLQLMAEAGYAGLDVALSEADPDTWAAGGLNDNANMRFRNTEYYASYVAAAYGQILELGRRYGSRVCPLAWAFMFPQEECFAGTRTFSPQGINKAVFNAFELLSRMGDDAIGLCSDAVADIVVDRAVDADFGLAAPRKYTGEGSQTVVSGLASRSDGAVQILVYAHCDDIDRNDESEVELRVTGLAPGSYRCTHYRIDADHSNAYAQWVAEGRPRYPRGERYERIKRADALERYEPDRVVSAEKGETMVTWRMPAHAVSMIILERQA